jgi:pimeloyl-ACP methyl ester carboxylesterase
MHREISVSVGPLTLSANIAGSIDRPAMCLLHGWPQTHAIYDGVLDELARDFHVLAFDLPAIGNSRGMPVAADKSTLADVMLSACEAAGARSPVMAGVDIGGMIAFAAARDHGARIKAAIVMNTVIPGIEPWSKVVADPRVWHFAFHNVPRLPELLVQGHQREYFDFFTDVLAGDPKRISSSLRDAFARAYSRPESLQAGFDWYRALEIDAKRNGARETISTPLLYLRGDADPRSIDDYVAGFEAAGVQHLQSAVVEDSGELLMLEAPERFIQLVREFALRHAEF